MLARRFAVVYIDTESWEERLHLLNGAAAFWEGLLVCPNSPDTRQGKNWGRSCHMAFSAIQSTAFEQ